MSGVFWTRPFVFGVLVALKDCIMLHKNNLLSELNQIYCKACKEEDAAHKRRALENNPEIKSRADVIYNKAVNRMKECARLLGQNCTVVDEVESTAKHGPNQRNICTVDDLKAVHALVYQRLIDQGLEVSFIYFEDKSHDIEDGYRGGFRMNASWVQKPKEPLKEEYV